jgi:NADPH:quinone reductase-like Zn-dependent oxidoreductase
VIDYLAEDFVRLGKKYDVIIGVNGYRPLSDYKGALNPGGRYVMAGGDNKQIFEALLKARWVFMGSGKKAAVVASYTGSDDLEIMKRLCEEGRIKPLIDRVFDFKETVEAFRYMETGHAKGKVVIKI